MAMHIVKAHVRILLSYLDLGVRKSLGLSQRLIKYLEDHYDPKRGQL